MDVSEFRVWITEEAIQARVKELGAAIRADLGDAPVLVVCVLKGSLLFFADLTRAIGGDVRFDYVAVSSYGAGTESSGHVRFVADLSQSVAGRDVLLVEDIVDTGRTIEYLRNVLLARAPRSLRIVTLLDKPSRRLVPVPVDYIGFSIEDEFVVGYGLDFDEKYRALPFIGVKIEP